MPCLVGFFPVAVLPYDLVPQTLFSRLALIIFIDKRHSGERAWGTIDTPRAGVEYLWGDETRLLLRC